jgi:phage FluMu protein Com
MLRNMAPDMTELRCDCGHLLARRTHRGIELKCRKCRRTIEISPDDLSAEPRELRFVVDAGPERAPIAAAHMARGGED